jgi:branched-chain amino acid transport system ATP-binding protein
LRGSDVRKTFGGLVAIDDVNFKINEDEIVGLIGPNGAGKTTLFNVITGVYSPDGGSMTFNSTDITGMVPHEIAKLGIARTFQTARTFNESTVLENVVVGAIYGTDESVDMEEAEEVAKLSLEFVGLANRESEQVNGFNIMDRKLLELARALAANPELILVDEVGSGLTPKELDGLTESLLAVRDDMGISVVWIEHIMDAIMAATDRIIVLNQGQKIADGVPSDIKNDQAVRQAYLGEDRAV